MAGFFDTLFGGGAEAEAAEKNRALASGYNTDAMGYLKSGYDTGTTNINKAISAYDPLASLAGKYNQAGDLYLNALGVNGPGGNAAASAAFQNAPGYTGAVTAGLDAINRRRGSSGMYDSGNADEDALTFGQNLQNQQYNTWLQNLAGAGQTGVGLAGNVATGQATGYGNLANLASNYAQNQTGVAGSVLNANTSANTLQAQGEAAGAKNLLGAGLSLAGLVAGGPIGGGLGSLLGSSGLGGAVSGMASNGLGSLLGNNWQANNPGRFASSYYGPVAA
ncbi:hypothetical protein [Bradyrhizobium sp. S3.7.6]